MIDKDVISRTSLVTGYVYNGSHEDALKLFFLEFGQQFHAGFMKSNLELTVSVDKSLVTMRAKCGCIEDANRAFNLTRIQDVITWTALVVGYAQNGLVEQGHEYFESMDKVCGIKPGPDHYACIIDLLGRSEKMNEAKELLNHMDAEPDAIVWKALLSACRVHGNLELAERATKALFELEPQNAMLSNIYSALCFWEDSTRLKRLMKSRGVCKEPGCSWIEMNIKVHMFLSED
ncbi:Pentatricopeptide repeat-containing protein [Camellia lanceoleosa]|uniref:Pentatricopeptide repeat-containing protein n=1 Tax=Camellia lanceoleosa TaxID=1840588 RepID=A0ACC0IGU8_9ERIC|nr:Pentatricopeptide repeat-containing protein [Camellia lanceoleosa]